MKSNTNLVFKNEKVIKTIYNTISMDGLNIALFYQELINYCARNILPCIKFKKLVDNMKKSVSIGVETKHSEIEGKSFTFRFANGKKCIPHPKKIKKGGEDSHYATDRLIVVADGVGGWKHHQVDPADFSKELCQNISNYFHLYELSLKIKEKSKTESFSSDNTDYESDTNNFSEKTALKLLIKSVSTAKSLGTSTCTILLLEKHNGKLFTSYIGDSSYMILRFDGKKEKYFKEFKSEPQMHLETFNTPYQVGQQGDNPEKAILNTHSLANNDLIISATDGLWDNLDANRIIEIINENLNLKYFPNVNTKELAKVLTDEARKKSLDKSYMSPFAKQARLYNYFYVGGKPDDITIIVSQVTNRENSDNSVDTSTTEDNEKNEDFLLLF